MTIDEFSWEFDILYNNLSNMSAPGVNDYEKSVFLTRAQEQLITELYTGTGISDGFDSSEQIRQYLNSLVRTIHIPDTDSIYSNFYNKYKEFPLNPIDNKILYTVNMYLVADKDLIPVFPITYDEYNITIKNPFKLNKKRVLGITSNNSIIIISNNVYNRIYLVVSYLTKPNPIILNNLNGVTIDGQDQQSAIIDVPESLHFEIVKRAVQLALVANNATE